MRGRVETEIEAGMQWGDGGGGGGGGQGSWELCVEGVDGWDVGWEGKTSMFVKRKGRGVFRYDGESTGEGEKWGNRPMLDEFGLGY